ncbi:copper resistance CopC family protein [Blastococcus brunescens]|uniref:Copper resistance protein CopC n=1 Tax=Blastococcus brunescens TaxID=1564165 RepID=A0ABZ1B3I3_9ACTN|nr:copper resistance protein CopC [Blastococcus sp. BMG 8361]WRL65367.1 copper resistance protein CopC [Blastococcus sp. BMG 8361]
MTVQRFLVLLVAGAIAMAGLLLGPGVTTASAHDALVAVTPADGGTLETAPEQVTLEFSGSPQELGTRVLVTAPDGRPVSDGPVELRDTTVSQALAADLPAGTYTVEWRVTSADGHPLSGTSTFDLAGGPPGSVAQADPTTPSAATAADTSGSLLSP